MGIPIRSGVRPACVIAALLPGSVFVNSDEIAKQRWPDDPSAHAYEAALIAADTRAKLIELSRPFIAETVFSHPSKLELIDTAGAAGYTVVLHVLLIPEELAVARVAYRVQAGGGIETPTLCWAPNLTPINACRVCMVEVEGSRVLVPSCTRKVEDGMVVRTDSEKVRHSRRMVLELLASSVDLSQASADVQRWMREYGVDAGRYGPPAPPSDDRDTATPGTTTPRTGRPRRQWPSR